MPKKLPDGERREHQVTFRITEEQRELIRQVAHLERKAGINDYLYEVVKRHVDALRSNESVTAALEIQERYDAGIAATTPLRRTGIGNDVADTDTSAK